MQRGGVGQRAPPRQKRGPARLHAPDRPRRAGAEGAALSGPSRTSRGRPRRGLGAEPCRAGELRLPRRVPRDTCPASTGCVRGTTGSDPRPLPAPAPVAAPGAPAAGRGMEPGGVGKLRGEWGWSRAGAQPLGKNVVWGPLRLFPAWEDRDACEKCRVCRSAPFRKVFRCKTRFCGYSWFVLKRTPSRKDAAVWGGAGGTAALGITPGHPAPGLGQEETSTGRGA